jgi:hypothetical protein
MIDQCVRALLRSRQLQHQREFRLAEEELATAIRNLSGLSVDEISSASEADLTAALLQGEPTQVLGQKVLLLAALLHAAGNNARMEGGSNRGLILKALQLELGVLIREPDVEVPEFVPGIDQLLSDLQDEKLPLPILGGLVMFYESRADFARAEDMLFQMLDSSPHDPSLREFGLQFYDRVARQSDETLLLGNLPRVEVDVGLAEFKNRTGES